ncbi:MAG: hypothetical protein FAZ92_01275 [Accumulibacter sp.]|nr:MAG: hypothetical protein FAZ92_01275 [Accumulibacter sp.]
MKTREVPPLLPVALAVPCGLPPTLQLPALRVLLRSHNAAAVGRRR